MRDFPEYARYARYARYAALSAAISTGPIRSAHSPAYPAYWLSTNFGYARYASCHHEPPKTTISYELLTTTIDHSSNNTRYEIDTKNNCSEQKKLLILRRDIRQTVFT
jgi:hypothetical protein